MEEPAWAGRLMQAFVAVVARPGRVIPEETRHRMLGGTPKLTFEAESDQSWSNDAGTVMLRCWEEPDAALGIDSHWVEEAGWVTAFAGKTWPRRGWSEDGSRTEQLGRICRGRRASEVAEDLAGVYSLITIDQHGSGWILSDPLGLSMIFKAQTQDCTVYATTAAVAAWISARGSAAPSRDALAAAWLAYSGHMVGTRTGFTGVRLLPVGQHVEIHPSDGPQDREWGCAPWNVERVQDAAAGEVVDLLGAEVDAFLAVSCSLPAREKIVGLTGGKDSRLILARLLGSGIASSVSYQTLGGQSLPDVQVARKIADHLRLDHRWGRVGPVVPTSFEQRMRTVVDETSGMMNVWDARPRLASPDTLNISGMVGEALRTNYPGTNGIVSMEQLERRFRSGWPFPPATLLRAEVANVLQGEAHRQIFEQQLLEPSPQDFVDVFYLSNRLRCRGIEMMMDRTNRLFPLYSLNGLRVAFAVGSAKRRAEFIHQRLIGAVSSELRDWRLAGDTWADKGDVPSGWAGGSPTGSRGGSARRGPVSAGSPVRRTTAKQRSQADAIPRRRAALRRCFTDNPSNTVFDVVDREKVLQALGRIEELRPREQIQIFGAATAALWLGGVDVGSGGGQ